MILLVTWHTTISHQSMVQGAYSMWLPLPVAAKGSLVRQTIEIYHKMPRCPSSTSSNRSECLFSDHPPPPRYRLTILAYHRVPALRPCPSDTPTPCNNHRSSEERGVVNIPIVFFCAVKLMGEGFLL
uniref:Uncharacterized protein n=1 Tax=Guillardia theta TaxID=55529 RepID=A0A7S4UAL9_GUITH